MLRAAESLAAQYVLGCLPTEAFQAEQRLRLDNLILWPADDRVKPTDRLEELAG
jgi:hypothetical protein